MGGDGGGPMAMERKMEGTGSVVRRNRSGGWEGAERMYDAVRENSIDFWKILYRLPSDTL